MAIRERSNNFFMDFEDNGFGGNAMEQNEALANIFYPPAPTPVPAPAPVPTPVAAPAPAPAPAFTDPLEYLFSLDVERDPERLPVAPPVETPVEFQPSFIETDPFRPPEQLPVAPPVETPVEPPPELLAPPAAPQPAPVEKSAGAPAPKTDYTEALTKQILGQGLTGKWSGEGYGSAENNAADMAKILSGIGITDIKQFGKVDKYEPVEKIGQTLNGQPVQGSGSDLYIMETVGSGDDAYYARRNLSPEEAEKVKPVYGVQSGIDEYNAPTYQPVNATNVTTKDGRLVGVTGQTFGNKKTGQAVPNTYTERQKGDFFGGTYEGKGNTGYGVQFDAQGNPVFYTQGASSSDVGSLAPFLTLASFVPGLAPFAMAANAAISAKQGNVLGAITSLAGMGGLAGISGMSDIANAAKYANILKSGDPLAILMAGASAGGITDIGGINLNDISKTIGGIKAIESGDPLAILRYGMSALPKDEKLTSSFGPGNEQDFKDNLISGYFQPGGEGYIDPSQDDPNAVTVQPEPTGIDDFLSSLDPFKQTFEPKTSSEPSEPYDFLKSIGINTIDPEPDSGLSNQGILDLINANDSTMFAAGDQDPIGQGMSGDILRNLENTGELPSPDDDFMPTIPSSSGDYESVFDPTFSGTMPINNPGYYNKITGEFISDPLGGLQNPLGPETGNIDPNSNWEYSLTQPGVWVSDTGKKIDLSYLPNTEKTMTGAEIMKKAGAMPGGSKKPSAAKPGTKPAAPPAKSSNPAIDAILRLANQQQNQQNALLSMMASDKSEGAKIKSYKDLFGEDLFGTDINLTPAGNE